MIVLKLFMTIIIFLFSCNTVENDNDEPNDPLTMLWEQTYDYKDWGPFVPPTLVNDSLVCFTGNNNINCLSILDGQYKWTSSIPNAGELIEKFLFDETSVYGFRGRNYLYTINLENGIERWHYEFSEQNRFGRYHDINQNYYVGIYDDTTGWVWAFSKEGDVVYSIDVYHSPWSVTYYHGKLYCGQGWRDNSILQTVGRVLCLDADSGDSLWAYNTVHGSFISNIPIFDNNVIYSGTVFSESGNSVVVALNADTGEEIWTFSREGQYAEYYDIKLVDGVLYCSTNTGVVAISADTGQELWFTEPVFSHNENTLDYWNGYIYIPHTGSLWVLEAETGEIVHKMRGPDKSPVLKVSAGAGKIFVQSSQHLYCYEPYDPEKDND